MKDQKNDPIKKIIAEMKTLEKDMSDFKKHVETIKAAPAEKDAEVIGNDHIKLVSDLEEISNLIENLPKKWEMVSKIKDTM
jgi:hypothetical protein